MANHNNLIQCSSDSEYKSLYLNKEHNCDYTSDTSEKQDAQLEVELEDIQSKAQTQLIKKQLLLRKREIMLRNRQIIRKKELLKNELQIQKNEQQLLMDELKKIRKIAKLLQEKI